VNTADVVVAGGGAVGCAIAFALARAGHAVALLERDAVGAHASRVAAGMLTPLSDVPGGHETVPLGLESLALFPGWVEELRGRTGIDPGLVLSGVLRVAHDAARAERLQARAAALAGHGVAWLDAAAARGREPGLAPGIAGALWSPREGHVGAEPWTRACARAAAALGARVEEGAPVTGLCLRGGRVAGVRTPRGDWSAPWLVLATGPWAGAEAATLGLPWAPPVEPVRGQIATLVPARPALSAIAWDERVYLVPRPDGRVRAGATEERAGFDCRTTEAAVQGLVEAAAALVPALAGAARAGAAAGLRPGTPDGLPLLGPAPGVEGLLLAIGHHRHGILLSPVSAQLVVDRLAGRPAPAAARAFAPDRFLPPGAC
jgi:glycine oxidase